MEISRHGMAWKGMVMTLKWNGIERFGNGVKMPMEWHGMTWQGMTMSWHGINRFMGLGLGGSFVSLCALTQKLGKNVQ